MTNDHTRSALPVNSQDDPHAPEDRLRHEAVRERAARTQTVVSGLDSVLSDPAISPSERWAVLVDLLQLPYQYGIRPWTTMQIAGRLASDVAEAALGGTPVSPAPEDDRWAHPAWQSNPLLRRLSQSYLALALNADQALAAANFEWRRERRIRMVVENVIDALAPTNFPITNPEVLQKTRDTKGRNFIAGARNFVHDMTHEPRLPSMVDRTAFKVGEHIAVTPGAVVLRTPMFELLQYKPVTEQVYEIPVLVVSPMVNKYYVVDLRPGRSLVEHLVASGQQVFAISWRNPKKRQSQWNLESYTRSLLDVLGVIETITGVAKAHLFGICAGGLLACSAATVLQHRGEQDRLAGMTLAVIPIDSRRPGVAGSVVTAETAGLAKAESARRGYISAYSLARVFAWLRPNEAIWRFYIHNYLLGEAPPAHDILFWNADATNMSAGLHADFVNLGLENAFMYPDRMTIMDVPVDLGKVGVDSYVLAGEADHIVPWQGCYSATRILGSSPRFVLSASGHIGAIVTPTTSRRAKYWTGPDGVEDPRTWFQDAELHNGSWWTDWTQWLQARSGELQNAPSVLGAPEFPALADAPGRYVHGRP